MDVDTTAVIELQIVLVGIMALIGSAGGYFIGEFAEPEGHPDYMKNNLRSKLLTVAGGILGGIVGVAITSCF